MQTDFCRGVLCAMLARGEDITRSAKIANKVASVGVTRKFAVSSIPKRHEIEKIISEMKD